MISMGEVVSACFGRGRWTSEVAKAPMSNKKMQTQIDFRQLMPDLLKSCFNPGPEVG
jgi:hypothetical protein